MLLITTGRFRANDCCKDFELLCDRGARIIDKPCLPFENDRRNGWPFVRGYEPLLSGAVTMA